MKILIVGGGIGGLALAEFLKKKGIDFTIAEKTSKWETVGYVLGLYPNGVRVLENLGLGKKVKKLAADLKGYTIANSNGKTIWKIGFGEWRKKYGPMLLLERDALHKILRENLKNSDMRLGTTVKLLKQKGDKAEVIFSDNKKELFDLVVGADGINSQIRDFVDPNSKKLSSGFAFWVMWVGKIFRFPKNIVYSVGSGKVFSIFPVRSKNYIGVAFSMPAKSKVPGDVRQFLKSNFSDMGGVVPKVLENLPPENKIFHHTIEDLKIKNWFRGRVVLLGDSVHPISPILGMGASMAMEDAFVLAEELSKSQSIQESLENYVVRRKKRVEFLQKKSMAAHKILGIKKPFSGLRDFLLKSGYSKSYYKSLGKFLGKKV